VDIAPGRPAILVVGTPDNLASELVRRAEQINTSRGGQLPEGRVIIAISPPVKSITDETTNAVAEGVPKCASRVQ
jgi:hypothetical protein